VFSKFIPLIPIPERKHYICYTMFVRLSAYGRPIIPRRNSYWGDQPSF
jgi:hypothetical protein